MQVSDIALASVEIAINTNLSLLYWEFVDLKQDELDFFPCVETKQGDLLYLYNFVM